MSVVVPSLAIELCRMIEAICPKFGCHVALTGGCLYKDGARKDIDILFYSVRQTEMDRDGLTFALKSAGLELISEHGWMQKMRWRGFVVDVFFPETPKTDADGHSGTGRGDRDPDTDRDAQQDREFMERNAPAFADEEFL